MKKIMILGVVICSLFITGCGCSKKEKKLECSSDIDEYNEKKKVSATFENDYLKTENVETITVFEDEISANRFYEMYKDSEIFEVNLNGNEVSLKQTVENDSENEIFKYDRFYEDLINQGFTCEKK